MFYINQRWLGGLLTNWITVQKSVKRLQELDEMATDGRYELLTKKRSSAWSANASICRPTLQASKTCAGCQTPCSWSIRTTRLLP